MDFVGNVPEQEPFALFGVFGGKGGEGSRGGRRWSDYILFLLPLLFSFLLLPDLSLLFVLLLFLMVTKGCCRCVRRARQLAHSLFFQAFVFFFLTFLQLWLVFLWNLKQVVCWLDTSPHNKHEVDSVCLQLSFIRLFVKVVLKQLSSVETTRIFPLKCIVSQCWKSFEIEKKSKSFQQHHTYLSSVTYHSMSWQRKNKCFLLYNGITQAQI